MGTALASLLDKAKLFIGGLAQAPESMDQFWEVMDKEYKASDMLRLNVWEDLRQHSQESIKDWSQRVLRESFELGVNETMRIRKFVHGLNGPHGFLMGVLGMRDRFESLSAITDAVDSYHKEIQSKLGKTKAPSTTTTTRRAPISRDRAAAKKTNEVAVDELEADSEDELWQEEVEVDVDTLDACPAEKRPAQESGDVMRRLKQRMERPD